MKASNNKLRSLASPWIIPVAALSLLAAAWPGKRQPIHDSRGRPIVVYAHPPCPPELMAIYNPIFDDFRRTHPDIDLRVLHITGQYEDKIKVMFAGRVAPDVIFMYPPALAAWVELGALQPLDALLAKNGQSRREDYFPVMLETFSYKGRLYGLPKDASAVVMYYNRDMFRACGVELPTKDWTWDDMVNAGKKLTRDSDGDGRVDQWGLDPYSWYAFVWQNGGDILDSEGRRCLLNEPHAREALQFWADLRLKHGITPTPEAATDLGAFQLFALGRIGMFFSIYPAVSIFRKQANFDWDIAHVPTGPRRRATEVAASALAVTCQSRNPEAAFEYVRWLTSEVGMKFLVSVESPSCVSLARSDLFVKSEGLPASKQVASEAMEYAQPPPQHPRYAEIMNCLNSEIMRVPMGRATVDEALSNAVPSVERILAR